MNKSKENSYSNNNINQNKFQNIRPLKTPKYNISKDIQLQFFDTFNSMKKEIDLIFPAMSKKVDLTSEEKKIRGDLILEIKHFINKYKMNQACFYSSIYLFDKLLAKKIKLKIYEVALGALILSVKFFELDGNSPHLNKFQEILKTNQKISLDRIFEIEIKCIKELRYKFNTPDAYSFINIILMYGIIFNTDSNKRKLSGSIYNLPLQIYEQIILANSDYLQFHPLLIAYACVAIARDIYKLDKWIPILSKVFNVNFYEFEEVYSFIYDLYNECKEKEIKKQKQKQIEDSMSNLNINKEVYNKNIINKSFDVRINTIKNEKIVNNNLEAIERRKINDQDSKEYILKSAFKYDLIRNPSEKTLKKYISKTKSMDINFDIKDLNNMKNRKEKQKEYFNNSFNENNFVERKNEIIVNRKNYDFNHNNQYLKINQSYNNNYSNQLKLDFKNLKNKEEKKKEMFFYNPVQKTNLSEYTSNKSKIISAVTRAKLSFLKESYSNFNFLNNSTKNVFINNKSLNISLNNYNNSFASTTTNSYQIKGINQNSSHKTLQTENNNVTKLTNNKYKNLFINKK